jgi:hypothetical protein
LIRVGCLGERYFASVDIGKSCSSNSIEMLVPALFTPLHGARLLDSHA